MKTTKETIVSFVETQPLVTRDAFSKIKCTKRDLSSLANAYLKYVKKVMKCYSSLESMFTSLTIEDSFEIFRSESERESKSLISKLLKLTPYESVISSMLEYVFDEEGLEISSLGSAEKEDFVAGMFLASLFQKAS